MHADALKNRQSTAVLHRLSCAVARAVVSDREAVLRRAGW